MPPTTTRLSVALGSWADAFPARTNRQANATGRCWGRITRASLLPNLLGPVTFVQLDIRAPWVSEKDNSDGTQIRQFRPDEGAIELDAHVLELLRERLEIPDLEPDVIKGGSLRAHQRSRRCLERQ